MQFFIEKDIEEQVIRWRRHLHKYPELSGQEKATAEYIAARLEEFGIQVQRFSGHYGLIGIIKGAKPGRIIALRADMDALPITEESGLEFASVHDGVMHACGHDCHMAILLGAAAVLVRGRMNLRGTVKLVFQPSEEASPDGGSRLMMADGSLDDVEAIYGLHVWPQLNTGEIALRSGYFLAASDRFRIKLFGQSAHAAQPHCGIDAIAMAADTVQRLNTMMARETNPLETATLSIGVIKGGERYNVMPSQSEIEGTVRTLGEATRRSVPEMMDRLLKGITTGYGGRYELMYLQGYPAVKNDVAEAVRLADAAGQVLGAGKVHADVEPSMIAEDFAYYQQQMPGVFFFLGCHGDSDAGLHNSRLNVNEDALTVGIKVFLAVVAKG